MLLKKDLFFLEFRSFLPISSGVCKPVSKIKNFVSRLSLNPSQKDKVKIKNIIKKERKKKGRKKKEEQKYSGKKKKGSLHRLVPGPLISGDSGQVRRLKRGGSNELRRTLLDPLLLPPDCEDPQG